MKIPENAFNINTSILLVIVTGSFSCTTVLEGEVPLEIRPSEMPVQERQDVGAQKVFAYDCEDGSHFIARLEVEVDTFTLALPEGTVQLKHLPSGSGARYGNETLTFWTKGAEALMIKGKSTVRCKENRRTSLLEEARLRGINFRGYGTEPGWILEIGNESIVLVTNYGSERYEFPLPDPEFYGAEGKTVYRVEGASDELVVVLEEKTCQDTMADQTYEVTVAITLGGKSLSGCGTPLH